MGRKKGAVVLTFLRSSRPRDLDHYERFLNYHLQQARWVEPVTLRPFSISVLERALGPLLVSWLRHTRQTDFDWTHKSAASNIKHESLGTSFTLREIRRFFTLLEGRNASQPKLSRLNNIPNNYMRDTLSNTVRVWQQTLAIVKG